MSEDKIVWLVCKTRYLKESKETVMLTLEGVFTTEKAAKECAVGKDSISILPVVLQDKRIKFISDE